MALSKVITLVLLTISLSILLSPITSKHTSAYAQDNDQITIKTSADTHDGKFFGQSVLQVVVYDPDYDSDSNRGTKNIDLDAEGDTGSDSTTIVVPETSNSSGKFEFFLSHTSATAVQPDDLDPLNNAGVQGDGSCIENCAPFVTFGPGSDLDSGSGLYEEVRFEIRVKDVMLVVDYEKTLGKLSLDREFYGPTSFVYVFVNDQDANLNPFGRDEFTFNPEASPNDDLFSLDGGEFVGAMTFRETGDNTAVFEGKFQLGSSIDPDSESLAITLHEKANYDATLGAQENDSNDTEEAFFVVRSTSGIISGGPGNEQNVPRTWDATLGSDKDSYAIGETITITTTDQDANVSSTAIDSINLEVSAGGSGTISVPAYETSKNSGIFVTTIILGSGTDPESALVVIPNGDYLTIKYIDPRPEDYAEKIAAGQNPEKEFILKIRVTQEAQESNLSAGIQSINMSIPAIKDATGRVQEGVGVGDHIVLSTITTNKLDAAQPFLAIIEVRDSDDATVLLEWQTGKLDPFGAADIGISWSPVLSGEYTIRTFAISDFVDLGILSQVAESKIIVGS